MRVAITGATGSVGNALVSHLENVTGCEVTAITRGAWRHPFGARALGCVGDLVEAHWPDGVFADTDAVVHAAAITRWDPSASAPRLFAVKPELLKGIGAALGRRVRLLSVPPSVLATAASLLGKQDMVHKLLGSLQLDIKPTCERLDWSPPLRAQDALRAAVRGWRHG